MENPENEEKYSFEDFYNDETFKFKNKVFKLVKERQISDQANISSNITELSERYFEIKVVSFSIESNLKKV